MNQPVPTETGSPGTRGKESEERPSPRWSRWGAPVWFLLGVLVGVMGSAVIALLTIWPVTGSATPSVPTVDMALFTLRDANRAGVKTARVTIVEFSDFQ